MKELNIKSRLHNEADVLEVDDKSLSEAVIPFIEADKDIISKIEMYYDEGSTNIYFPYGIIPLSITFNTHTLYFLNNNIVDRNKQEVEGYSLQDLTTEENEEGKMVIAMSLEGDISEQIINSLIYVNYDKYPFVPVNSYYLFFPVTESGTKLYQHRINLNSDTVTFNIISNTSTPIDLDALVNGIFTGYDGVLLISPEMANDVWFSNPYSVTFDTGDIRIIAYFGEEGTEKYFEFTVVPTIVDTVTPL